MAAETVSQHAQGLEFIPGKTLGRSGYIPGPSDRLAERIRQLDALLILISDGYNSNEPEGLPALNHEIQGAVINLASSVASEIHELHEEVAIARLNAMNA